MITECYCTPQAAMAACLRIATGLGEAVAAFPRAGTVSMPFITLESLGEGTYSGYSGGSTEEGFTRVTVHACSGKDAANLAEVSREGLRRCGGADTMAGRLCIVQLSHPRIILGREAGEYVGTFRVTHKTTRSESYAS